MPSEPIIETVGLTKEYEMKGETIQALRDISLQVRKGEYVSVLGPSGSGKTTLLNLIGGLDFPTAGSVIVEGLDLSRMTSIERATMRCRRIGYIFQTFNLIPFLSALDNVALPMVLAGVPLYVRTEKARQLLKEVGLSGREHHRPPELSGGQLQRVAIARALANDPAIILADEPTGNLDLKTGFSIVQLLYRLKTEKQVTVLCATHDLKMIEVSDRIAWLEGGQIRSIETQQTVTLTAQELNH